MITHGLFPTPVSLFHLGRELTAEEADFLLNQEQKFNTGNTTSVDRYLLERPTLSSVREFVEASLDKYFEDICSPKQDVKLRITQSWTNNTRAGQFHHKHEHPNSFISGVFYVKANKETDKIHFFKTGYQQIKLPVNQWNLFNSDSWWLPVGTGELLLFPSHLTHMVETVKDSDMRVSMAFNTFPVGHVGDEDSLTGLNL